MNALAKSNPALPEADPFYALRDDLARVYNPVNALERMLVTAAAQGWFRFQQASQLERRIFENAAPAELFAADGNAFRMLARYIADAERAWRLALHQLQSAQRSRVKSTSLIRQHYDHDARTARAV